MFVQGIQALDSLFIYIYYELLIHAYGCYEVKYNQMSGNESRPKKVEFLMRVHSKNMMTTLSIYT